MTTWEILLHGAGKAAKATMGKKSRSWLRPDGVEPDRARKYKEELRLLGWRVELMRPKHAKCEEARKMTRMEQVAKKRLTSVLLCSAASEKTGSKTAYVNGAV